MIKYPAIVCVCVCDKMTKIHYICMKLSNINKNRNNVKEKKKTEKKDRKIENVCLSGFVAYKEWLWYLLWEAINSDYLSSQAFMFSPKMYHLKLTMSSCWTYLTLCFSRCNSSQLMSGMLRFKFIWGFVFRHYIFTKGQYHTRIQLQNVCDSPL